MDDTDRIMQICNDAEGDKLERIAKVLGFGATDDAQPAPAVAVEAKTNHQIALENIAFEKPRFEAASKSTGSPERMRCFHCGFAWQPDAKPFHAFGCAYVEATNALAARSAPAVAEKVPLTPEQANNVWRRWVAAGHVQCDWLSLLRLTEAAHGIGSGSAQEGQAK